MLMLMLMLWLWLLRLSFWHDALRDEVQLPLDFVRAIDKWVLLFELLMVLVVMSEELLFAIRRKVKRRLTVLFGFLHVLRAVFFLVLRFIIILIRVILL